MGIVLFRVDERLIHGQVVIGWGHELRPDRYILVDDELAESEWEQDLYRLGAVDADVMFAGVDEGRRRLQEWREDPRRSIVLSRDVGTMRRLAEGGRLRGEKLNLGGVHHGPGREKVLRYLHLTDEDRQALEALADDGVEVSARELPDSPRVGLATILGES